MKFINNIEKLGFEKSTWPLIEISPDGNTIYMGKPKTDSADYRDSCWFIKRITIATSPEGWQSIVTQVAEGGWNNAWIERHRLTYKYM